jgi:putative transposase
VHRAFDFLLQPTTRQRQSLTALLDVQRELYNAALEERRGAWRWERRYVTRFDQYLTLTSMREVRPDLLSWGVVVCRGTLARLDEAFQGFHRRYARGVRPGFPRFKPASRWNSASWPDDAGWHLDCDARRLYVQGVGNVKVRLHRPIAGVPKTLTIRREGRRWRVAVFCAEVPLRPLPPTGRVVGIDAGITNLIATSEGHLVDNPRFGRQAAAQLARAQVALERKQRWSKRRRKAVARLAACHHKIRNQRRDHAHKLSRQLVNDYDVIVHEELAIADMMRRPTPRPDGKGGYEPNGATAKSGLNRSIQDAGWGQFLRFIAYKAEEAGRQVIAVDARNTSRRCAYCGRIDGASRRGAVFRCTACGHSDQADVNAARNILRAGLAQRPTP